MGKSIAVVQKEAKEVAQLNNRAMTPLDMICAAVNNAADLDKVTKLLEIQERWEALEARKAYHKAMSAFKANAPKIIKDKKANYSTDKGNVKYSHASLFNIVDKISTELSKHDLSATWKTLQNGAIAVTCKITHALGHSEETTLSAQNDKSGSKNDIQALGSTITYLERYTLLALTGLATKDQDDDAQSTDLQQATTNPAVSNDQMKKKMLDSFADAKNSFIKLTGNDKAFYRVIGDAGFANEKEIPDITTMQKIFTAINDKYRSVKKDMGK